MIRTALSACIRVHLLLICVRIFFLRICKFAPSPPDECQRTKKIRPEHDFDRLRERIDEARGAAIVLNTGSRNAHAERCAGNRSPARVLRCVLRAL